MKLQTHIQNDKIGTSSLFNRYVTIVPTLLLITLISLYPTLFNGWVNWDDPAYVLKNELIAELSIERLSALFTTLQVQGLYHPLTLLSLAIDHAFVEDQAWLYHAHNLILHLLNVLLVFKFIELVSSNRVVALITALLFGIHPMHVESVAWISERKDVLYAFYFLLALISYLYYLNEKKGRILLFLATLTFFVLSLLAKPMAVTLPIVLLLVDWLQKRKLGTQIVLEKLPFLLLSIVFGIVAIFAQQEGHALFEINDLQWNQTVFIGTYGVFLYLVKLIVPFQMSAFHPYPETMGGGLPWYIYTSVVPILALIYLIWAKILAKRHLLFSIGFFLICIAPVLQIISVGKAIISERYTYLPYIGLFYIVALTWQHYIFHKSKRSSYLQWPNIVLFLYISAMVWTTNNRSKVWENNITLWSDVMTKYPEDHMAYCNRASSYFALNQLDPALTDCNECVRLQPELYESYNNRGLVYLYRSNTDAALKDFNEALSLKKDYTQALGNRSALLMNTGRNEEAFEDLQQLKQLTPSDANVRFNIAIVLDRMNKSQAALREIDAAIKLESSRGLFYHFRAKVHENLKKAPLALEDLKTALILGYPVKRTQIQAMEKLVEDNEVRDSNDN